MGWDEEWGGMKNGGGDEEWGGKEWGEIKNGVVGHRMGWDTERDRLVTTHCFPPPSPRAKRRPSCKSASFV